MIRIIIVSYSIFVSQNILIAPASALRVGGGNPLLHPPPQLQSKCDSGFATVQPFTFKHPPLLKSGSSPATSGPYKNRPVESGEGASDLQEALRTNREEVKFSV